jgi:hypothetical protein
MYLLSFLVHVSCFINKYTKHSINRYNTSISILIYFLKLLLWLILTLFNWLSNKIIPVIFLYLIINTSTSVFCVLILIQLYAKPAIIYSIVLDMKYGVYTEILGFYQHQEVWSFDKTNLKFCIVCRKPGGLTWVSRKIQVKDSLHSAVNKS